MEFRSSAPSTRAEIKFCEKVEYVVLDEESDSEESEIRNTGIKALKVEAIEVEGSTIDKGHIVENLQQSLCAGLGEKLKRHEYEDELKKIRAEGKEVHFRDDTFQPQSASLYFSADRGRKWNVIDWKRIQDISKKPKLLKDGVSSDDIIQGYLGDCWFLSACASVSRQPKYMNKIIPPDQITDGENYSGLFHFRFWRFGSWTDVAVDDYLPTEYNRLAFGRSGDPDEFWLPLLEKAYAKLHGSYEAIIGGQTVDALEDLTGGMAVTYDLGSKTPPNLFPKVLKAFNNESFICASINRIGSSTAKRTGLVACHAYSVTGARKISFRGSQVNLIRVRNPWGNKTEWTGDWSDESKLWKELDSKTRGRLEYADEENGEWWMTWDDFAKYFYHITICTLGPDFNKDGAQIGDKWLLSVVKSEWIPRVNAGGSRNDVYKYVTNPQYYLELTEPDVFDPERDDPEEKGKCSLVMGLMQEGRRAGKKEGMKNLNLCINVYKVDKKPTRKLAVNYFRYHLSAADSGSYINKREVSLTAQLKPGHYIIIPSTFYADQHASFLLRVFTERPIDLKTLV